MRVIVLLVLIAWLVTSLPQDAFIWASTTHAEGSWHFQMSYGRAFLLGFLPILTIWVEGVLATRHLDETRKDYREREKRWNRRAGRRDAQWATDNPLIDEERFYETHVTPAKQLATWVPRMFFLLIAIIAISYFGYYEEFGKDLAMFNIKLGDFELGKTIFEPLVAVVRTFITGVVTYVLGKIAAVLGVQDLPKDFGVWLGKVWAWVFPEKPIVEETPQPATQKPARSRSDYSHWPERNAQARQEEIVRYVRDHDPRHEGVEVTDIWEAVWNSRKGSSSIKYADIQDLVTKGILEEVNGDSNGRRVRLKLNRSGF